VFEHRYRKCVGTQRRVQCMVQKRRNRNLRLSEFGINDVLLPQDPSGWPVYDFPAIARGARPLHFAGGTGWLVWGSADWEGTPEATPDIRICYSVRKKMIEWRSAQSGYSIGFVGDRAVCQILPQPVHSPVIWKICDPPGNLIGSAASFVDAKLWCEKRFGHGNLGKLR
jgi:hypothetical protein